jgi:hypothetical protein
VGRKVIRGKSPSLAPRAEREREAWIVERGGEVEADVASAELMAGERRGGSATIASGHLAPEEFGERRVERTFSRVRPSG